MKVPLSWLREYVDITLPVAQLVERLTTAGLEVSGVRPVGLPAPEGVRVKPEDVGPVWDRDKIMVAEVLEVRRHPDADRLTLVDVNFGQQPKTLVTGATNIKVGDRGQKVILALTGATLFDGHAETKVLKQLKPTKIRGVPSDAMVCSAKELGLADDHEGIILLDADAPVGKPLADLLGDIVIEIDVLPNMARCLSLIGIAREVAALTGQPLRLPPRAVQAAGGDIQAKVAVEIEDAKLCGRYAAALIEGVKLGPAPGWMQHRLALAGMRPIGNIVDITNYVMLEWGQPLHAFDYDKLAARAQGKPPTIIVRAARPGETLKTLDGVERKLTPENLLIADTAGAIALAGVMGGAETEVTAGTKNILLEAASFDFISIRRTARQLDLPSEASHRFSRGVHPELVGHAAARATELMRLHAGGTPRKGIVEQYPAPLPARRITLRMTEVRRLLGFDLPAAEASRILTALEFGVADQGAGTLAVTAPPHRLDLQHGEADLIEEIIRIHGYGQLPATLLSDRLPPQVGDRARELEEQVRDLLVTAGLQEVMTYSLTTPEHEAPLLGPGAAYVALANPVSSERRVMRRSLLASVLEVAAANLRNRDAVCLFEAGFVYLPEPGAKFPREPRRLAVVMTGPRHAEHFTQPGLAAPLDFFDLKGVVEALLGDLHVAAVTYVPADASWLHPGQAADVHVAGKAVGSFGQLHPRLNEAYKLGRRNIYVAELDLDALLAAVPPRHACTPIPEFPPVRQDIAIIVDAALPASRVADEIWAGGKPMLCGVRLFDVYRGGNIPADKKSLAYALTYQAEDRTLTDKEVAKIHGKIVSRLEKMLGAQLRA
jgi:phenylalanyl-tRNA synthetase beta chain